MDKVNAYEIGEFWEVIPRSKSTDRPHNPEISTSWYPMKGYVYRRLMQRRWFHLTLRLASFASTTQDFRYWVWDTATQGEIPGTKAVLEVRAQEIPIFLEHGQLVGKLIYHQMAQLPDKVYGRSIGSLISSKALHSASNSEPPVPATNDGVAISLVFREMWNSQLAIPPRSFRACGFVTLNVLGNLDDALRRCDRTLPTVRLELSEHKLSLRVARVAVFSQASSSMVELLQRNKCRRRRQRNRDCP